MSKKKDEICGLPRRQKFPSARGSVFRAKPKNRVDSEISKNIKQSINCQNFIDLWHLKKKQFRKARHNKKT
jgi:hypothetical protein